MTKKRTITSLSFPMGVTDWDNRVHLWALNYRSQNSSVWHMFLKYICRENENESQITERGFFSLKTIIQTPLSVFLNMFLFERYKSISEQHIFRNFCIFLPPHKFGFEIRKEVIRYIFWGYWNWFVKLI